MRYDKLIAKLHRIQAKYERDVRTLLRAFAAQDEATDRAIVKHLDRQTPTGRAPMSAKQRKAISMRMKAMWRRKAKADRVVNHAA